MRGGGSRFGRFLLNSSLIRCIPRWWGQDLDRSDLLLEIFRLLYQDLRYVKHCIVINVEEEEQETWSATASYNLDVLQSAAQKVA